MLFYHGKELNELKKTLEEYQVGQNEIIHMQQIKQGQTVAGGSSRYEKS